MNMKTFTTKCSILALMLLIFTQGVYAQSKEANNWYFGMGGAMTWNQTQDIDVGGGKILTGLPTPLTDGTGMNNQQEGTFCMSDKEGNLLFYSDGMTIWNRTHQVMENGSGLFGHNSSAQSGIVMPYPGQHGKYIAVSVSLNNNSGGHVGNRMAYSIVDMSLQGGLGEVTTKNVLLTGHRGVLGEAVAAVKHSNGIDFWIIGVGKGAGINSALNVWSVTAAGVNTTCVGSYQLAANTTANAAMNGYLRFSNDGKYFAWAEGPLSMNTHFGEFNPSDGTVPTRKVAQFSFRLYGPEFSTSSQLLYVARNVDVAAQNEPIRIFKFAELLAAANPSSVVPRLMPAPGRPGALQLGPDRRIYGGDFLSSKMVVIENIDDFDNATAHHIDGLMAGQGYLGLPNFMSHIFTSVDIGSNQTICHNTIPAQLMSMDDAKCGTETVSYLWQRSTDSLSWSNATGTNNLTTYQPPALTATTFYRRNATSPSCGTEHSNIVKITVAAVRVAGAIAGNQNIASGATPATITSTTPASGGVGITTYQWQSSPDNATWTDVSGAVNEAYQPAPLTATTYFRRAAINSCGTPLYTASVMITITGTADMITVTGNSASICNGAAVTLSATASAVTNPEFKWYDAATGGTLLHTGATFTPSPNLTTTTTYYVSVSGTSQAESPRKPVTVTVLPTTSPDMIKISQ